MKILQYVTDLWTMNITFYKEKLNPLSSLMTGATYWCKKQTAIVLVSDRQRNAASQKLSKPMILARYFIHVWIGVGHGCENPFSNGVLRGQADDWYQALISLLNGATMSHWGINAYVIFITRVINDHHRRSGDHHPSNLHHQSGDQPSLRITGLITFDTIIISSTKIISTTC